MMTVLIIVAATLVALLLVLMLLGSRLPAAHKASVRARIGAPATALFARITDVAAYPSWNASVRKVERLPDDAGREHWLVHDKNGKLPSAVVERTPPTATAPGRYVTEITDRKLPFGGRWIWEVFTDGTVSIIEDGFVRNLVFRFLARTAFGYTATMEKTLAALARSFASDAKPEIVDAGR